MLRSRLAAADAFSERLNIASATRARPHTSLSAAGQIRQQSHWVDGNVIQSAHQANVLRLPFYVQTTPRGRPTEALLRYQQNAAPPNPAAGTLSPVLIITTFPLVRQRA